MKKLLFCLAAALALLMPVRALAGVPRSGYPRYSGISHPRARCSFCARNFRGRIRRNPAARREFMRLHSCPSTERGYGACPGYVVDHVVALKRGGKDSPSNMQWQTTAEAKAKDRIE